MIRMIYSDSFENLYCMVEECGVEFPERHKLYTAAMNILEEMKNQDYPLPTLVILDPDSVLNNLSFEYHISYAEESVLFLDLIWIDSLRWECKTLKEYFDSPESVNRTSDTTKDLVRDFNKDMRHKLMKKL